MTGKRAPSGPKPKIKPAAMTPAEQVANAFATPPVAPPPPATVPSASPLPGTVPAATPAAPAGAVPGPGSSDSTNTALKRIPLTLTVRKQYDFFSEFIDEFGAHVYSEGMFIPAEKPKPKGAAVRIDFKLRDGFQILLVVGEVVRADEGLPGTTNGMWVSFRVMNPDQAALVRRIVDQREADTTNTPSQPVPAAPKRVEPALAAKGEGSEPGGGDGA